MRKNSERPTKKQSTTSNNNHTTNLENNTNPTLNSDVNDYISSPTKIKSVDGNEVQTSTKENSTQETDYCGHLGVGRTKQNLRLLPTDHCFNTFLCSFVARL